MASLGQAKMLGGVGAILAVLFWVPAHVGLVLLTAGLVLMLFAVRNISDTLGDQAIFTNMIYSVILAIIGPIIATLILFAAAEFIFNAFTRLISDSVGMTGPVVIPSEFWTAIGIVILAGVVLWVCILVSTVFLKRSYDVIAMKLRVDMFRTSGLLFVIGGATVIILVGFLILFIAAVLQIVAFFSIPEKPQPSMAPQQTWGQPPPSAGSIGSDCSLLFRGAL